MAFLGNSFNSLKEFNEFLANYETETCTKYFKRRSESVAVARSNGIKRHMRDDLKFYSTKFHCIHGGKTFKSMSTGARETSTFQQNCTACFTVVIDKTGEKLVISQANLEHNHVCNKALYEKLPQVRILPNQQKKEVGELLQLGANKKKLMVKVEQETNKKPSLKDFSNISSKLKTVGNDLVSVVQMLESQYAAECKVLEYNSVFKGLFFTTPEMKKSFDANPDFMGIDGTFKLLNIRAPVYLAVVEDGEGVTEIVAVAILVNEDAESVKWFVTSFKEAHPSWPKIRCVMADKDLNERSVIKAEFPRANVLICIFHTLRIFSREISCEKMGITPGQRDSAKEVLSQMLYASTEAEYQQHYAKLSMLPRTVKTYVDENWHSIRGEWTLSADFMQSNFMNTTNNRVESLNAKIKSVVKKYSSLMDFIKDFFTLRACLKSEHDKRAAYSYFRVPAVPYESGGPEHFYSKLLTAYAFTFVKEELKASSAVVITGDATVCQFRHNSSGEYLTVTESSCECTRFSSMLLPCRHIFALRQKLKVDMNDESLCAKRWTKSDYWSTQSVFADVGLENILQDGVQLEERPDAGVGIAACDIQTAKPKTVLSANQKFRQAQMEATKLASLAAEVSGADYAERLKILSQIREAWEKGERVVVGLLNVVATTSPATTSPATTSPATTSPATTSLAITSLAASSAAASGPAAVSAAATSITTASAAATTHAVVTTSSTERAAGPTTATIVRVAATSTTTTRAVVTTATTGRAPTGRATERAVDASATTGRAAVTSAATPPALTDEDLQPSTSAAAAERQKIAIATRLSQIKLPPAVKPKGRPKGAETTAVGLPKKRNLCDHRRMPIPFAKKRQAEKSLIILSWFVGEELAKLALTKTTKIAEKDVEVLAENIPWAILDPDVNLPMVEEYFTSDAWGVVQALLLMKQADELCVCGQCKADLDITIQSNLLDPKLAIRCDYCLEWFHLACTLLTKKPKLKLWMCANCRR